MATENSNSLIPDERIVDKIYLIREQKVMLDRDLAELYGVETRRLKESVKRNLFRFPEDFMFELTKLEVAICDLQLIEILYLQKQVEWQRKNCKIW